MKTNNHKWSHRARRVSIIPLVPKSASHIVQSTIGNTKGLVKVYAQPTGIAEQRSESELKALDKDWPLVAAPLRETGSALFQAGCAAVSAVRTLAITRPKFAIYQKLKPQASFESLRMYTAGHLGPSEGGSAQLGLALVLLMAATGTSTRNVIATGILSSQCNRDFDTKINPVGKLREKLQLVLEHAQSGQLSLPANNSRHPLLFFTPKQCEIDEITYNVIELPEVKSLRDFGIKVEPVEWLSEAAEKLNALTTRYHIMDRVFQWLMAVVSISMVSILLGFSWMQAELPMKFIPADQYSAAEPFISCFTGDGDYYPEEMQKEGLMPSIPTAATIGWKLRLGDTAFIDHKLAQWKLFSGYYIAIVMLAEYSPSKVIVPTTSNSKEALQFAPGEIMEWGWKLNTKTEANRLIVLSRRYPSYNANSLRAELTNKFPLAAGSNNENAGLDITAASNFLIELGTGSLMFQFSTTPGNPPCQRVQYSSSF